MTATDLNLNHLQAELARIDVLIQREVQRWQLAGQNPHDAFRGLHLSDDDIQKLLHRPLGLSWGQTVLLPDEKERYWTALQAKTAAYSRSLVERADQRQQPLRLIQLADAFGLSQFEVDTLLVCLAPNLDLRYERLYGYLQDDVTRRWPSVNLILDLLAEPGPNRLTRLPHFSDDAPLFKFNLLERETAVESSVHPVLAQTLHVDQAIISWLLGRYQPHSDLTGYVSLWSAPAATDLLLAAPLEPDLQRLNVSGQPLVIFSGPDQVAQEAAARLLAAQIGRPVFWVNLSAAVKSGLSPRRAVRLALRDARLTGAVPGLFGWEACLPEAHDSFPTDLLADLYDFPHLLLLAGEVPWRAEGLQPGRNIFKFEFPTPAYVHRLTLWQHFLGSEDETRGVGEQRSRGAEEQGSTTSNLPTFQPPTSNLQPANLPTSNLPTSNLPTFQPSLDLPALAGQFALTTGQIQDVLISARSLAVQQQKPLSNKELFAAARAHSNPRLADLARKITPRYRWDDLILPADKVAVLQELVATVRKRPIVLEQWGVGRKLASSRGVTVLFAGDPGTGKTMAAEVIAGELELDLYKIDLSSVVSKYIGETEKNLEKIFREAASSNAILFFDEADSIFGKRSEVKDAHDRYANIEISYLLQRMEAYDGVTILATNLRANLDDAFTRRLQFAVDFPFPKPPDRERIWQTLFPPNLPRDPNLDFELLAERFKLPGGNIRNIILSAAYLAANDGEVVTMEHVMHGVRREYQKMGRLVDERELKVEG